MKRLIFLSIVLLLLTMGFGSQSFAQGDVIIVVPPNNTDSDGDGLPDSDDQCPKKAGPRTNRGCPERDTEDDNSDSGGSDSGGSGSGNSGSNDSDPVDNPNQDSDGDGLSDKDDRCPKDGGPTWTGGCPEDENPPTVPDPNDVPNPTDDDPFVPPAFPSDGCYVTPNGNYNVNVRKASDVTSLQIGFLLSGVVYKSDGYNTVGADTWFVVNQYEGSTGDIGYAFGSVLLSSGCDESVAGGDNNAPDGLTDLPDTPLCHLSVGYDSPTWSNDPQVPSYTYAAFWFAVEPGQPIPAGTPAWGVIYVADFITLPDSDNVIAIAPDAGLFAEASNAPYAGLYNWPTMNGGIQSGDKKLFRLSPPYNSGACGPIVDIDDFTTVPDVPDAGKANIHLPINEFACTVETPFNWVFAFNFAPGEIIPEGTHPIAILNGDHDIAGNVNLWTTSMKLLGDHLYEYISYEGWAELPRTGGDCGWTGDPARLASIGRNNMKQLGIALHSYFDSDRGGSDLLIFNNGDGSDFDNDDGDLDLYLVNAPGGDNAHEWPWQVGLVMTFDETPPSGHNNMAEYCVYLEVHEAGVFEEVCYQVEVPLGCTLVAQEAGVYKIVCIDDISINESDPIPGWDGDDADIDLAWEYCPEGWDVLPDGTLICSPLVIDGDEIISDCNRNGIPDLDEFFPPDCYGKLTSSNEHRNADDGPEDSELDFLWEQCPDGWVWYDDVGLVCEPLIIED